MIINQTYNSHFDLSLLSQYLKSHTKALEIGCSYGRLLRILAEEKKIAHLAGIDVFLPDLLQCHSKLPRDNCTLAAASAAALPFSCEQFDVIVLSTTIGYLPSNEKQRQVIAECWQCLKKEGVFYFADFLLNEDSRNRQRYHSFENNKELPYGCFHYKEMILRHHTIDHIHQLTQPFHCLEFHEITTKTMNNNTSKGFIGLYRK